MHLCAVLTLCLVLAGCAVSQTVNDLSSSSLVQSLTSFTNDALGVSATQALYSGSVQSSSRSVDGDATATTLATNIGQRLSNRLAAVSRLRDTAINAFNSGATRSSLTECCRISDSQVTFDARFNTTVLTNNGCDRISSTASSSRPTISSTITSIAQSNLRSYPELKFQYFGSEQGYTSIYPGFNTSSCSNYDPRYRPWYVAAAVPTRKDVVVVIDTSASMNRFVSAGRNRLDLAKEALNSIITTLSEEDRISILPFSDVAGTLAASSNVSCFGRRLGQVTPYNVRQLQYHVNLLTPRGGTGYGPAISTAYSIFRASPTRPDTRRIILFLTDGQPGDSATSILTAQRAGAALFNFQATVLTYAMGTDIPGTGETLLRQMAAQQYSPPAINPALGEYHLIDNFDNLRASLSRYYSFFASESTSGTTIITMPYYDAFGLGVILTAASPVYTGTTGTHVLRGVVGVDITISDLFGDISYFSDAEHQYAFLINNDGEAVLHPLLSQPVDVSTDPLLQDVTLLEPDAAFRDNVYFQMRNRTSGSATFIATRYRAVGNSRFEGTESVLINSTYYWRPIVGTEFSLAIVLAGDTFNEVNTLTAQPAPSMPTVYHRLDLSVNRGARCNQYGRLALSDVSAVKFSPEAFSSPAQYLNVPETRSTVASYLSYLDGTAPNNFFKADVRNSVRLTSALDNIWRSAAAQTDSFRRSVVWRYIGGIDGTFRIIPGTQLPTAYDHMYRDWFTRGLNRPGQMTLSAPYLDAFGSGYVATLSHTITQSRQSSRVDAVGAVMGIDFTVGFLGETLTQAYPQCTSQFRCVLFDTSGYLIYHPDFVLSSANPEWVHLGHKEPYVMRELLRAGIAVKTTCARYDLLQRFITYNISVAEPFSGSLFGCSRVSFKVEAVANSNVIIAFLSSTACSQRSNFICRCGTSNNLGECVTSAATSCECPCAEPLPYTACTNSFSARYDVCPAEVAGLPVVPRRQDAVVGLESCFNGTCSKLPHSSDCRATQGCSWCTHDSSNIQLSTSFCTTDCVCFGGVMDRKNPAAGCDAAANNNNNNKNSTSSGLPVGSYVGIAVGSVFVVFGTLWYCDQKKKREAAGRRPPSTATTAAVIVEQPAHQPAPAPTYKPQPAVNPSAPQAPPDYNSAVHLGGAPGGYPSASYAPPYPSSGGQLPYPT